MLIDHLNGSEIFVDHSHIHLNCAVNHFDVSVDSGNYLYNEIDFELIRRKFYVVVVVVVVVSDIFVFVRNSVVIVIVVVVDNIIGYKQHRSIRLIRCSG